MSEAAINVAAVDSIPDRHLGRNFFLGVLNGSMFGFSESLLSVDTVLTWFVHQLGGSNFLIGLVGPLRDVGWYLPQLFVAHRLQRESRKLPLYRRVATIRAAAWLTWTLATFFVRDFGALLLIFFAAYATNSLASGFAGLSFMDIVAKTIPIRRRGSFFGARMLGGALLGLAASTLVGLMLAEGNSVPFPLNVGVLFVVSWVAIVIGLGSFSLVVEPEGEVRGEADTLRSHVRRATQLPRQHHNLRYFLITRIVLFLAFIAVPFYSIYSINVLGAPAAIIGLYVGVRTAVSLAINPVWSRLSDRRGNKIVLRLAIACGLAMATWALLAPWIAQSLSVDASVKVYLFVPVFLLMGLYDTGIGIGALNLLLEIAPGNDRAIYVGFTNTILGVAYMSTVVSGLLVDWLGYQGVFAIAASFLGVGLWAVSRIHEPRELARISHER